MALRLTSRSPRGTGLSSPRRLAATCQARLDPSVGGSGPRGLTVRPRCIRLPHQKRPSPPAQRFVTMAKRLCCERGMASLNHNFFVSEIDIFLCGSLDSSGKTGGGILDLLPVGSDRPGPVMAGFNGDHMERQPRAVSGSL